MTRELHCYDYVPATYARVRQVLVRDAAAVFRHATTAAARRGDEITATLQVPMGPLTVGAEVVVRLGEMTEVVSALGEPTTRLEVSWTAASGTSLLPTMDATLSIYALSPGETQLDFHGRYHVPMGAFGDAVDGLVGHRIAQASVLRFVQDVAARLRAEMTLGG